MPAPGDELLNPHTGQTIRFVAIDPELLVMESTYRAGGAPAPPHFHPAQDEHFEVLAGAVRATVDGEARTLEQGHTLDVPAGTVHDFGGDPERDATVRWEVRPGTQDGRVLRDDVRAGLGRGRAAGGWRGGAVGALSRASSGWLRPARCPTTPQR